MKNKTYTIEYAFMLRCWFEDENSGWRFMLEPIGQDWQRAGFTDLEKLLSFLEQQLHGSEGTAGAAGAPAVKE